MPSFLIFGGEKGVEKTAFRVQRLGAVKADQGHVIRDFKGQGLVGHLPVTL